MRIRQPKTTALIFATGKIVLTGSKNEEESMLAAKIFTKIVGKVLKKSFVESNFMIQNMVACADCGFSVWLEGLFEKTKATFSCMYEPDIFPGLTFRMQSPKLVLLIFTSGKIVFAGAK